MKYQKKIFKIGTRGSLLAKTQCQQIKDKLVQKTGEQFELDFVKTQGDLQTDCPLWQLEGKDFFTKELDAALIAGSVDLVVHSYKDLGSERPVGIKLGAITKRAFNNDLLLIKKSLLDEIHTLKVLSIGTSSPRRIFHMENYLSAFMPANKAQGEVSKGSEGQTSKLKVATKMLRGNINTRLKKLQEDQYHGIVLALAGIERLAKSPSSAAELQTLLQGLTFMALPTTTFPAAASQGALAIEYFDGEKDQKRGQVTSGEKTRSVVEALNHTDTIDEIKRERQAFLNYGGGCHLAVGVSVLKVKDHFLHIHSGEKDGEKVKCQSLERPGPIPAIEGPFFIGLPQQKLMKYESQLSLQDTITSDQITHRALLSHELPDRGNLYITSNHCLNLHQQGKKNSQERENLKKLKMADSLWASGTNTMMALAQQGLWVNGSSDSLGETVLLNLKKSKALQMMYASENPWYTLSHQEAESAVGTVIATYQRQIEEQIPDHYPTQIQNCQTFYWCSFFQYQIHLKLYPEIKTKMHCCGLGKTYDLFLKNGIKVYPFASINNFLQERE